MCVSVSECVCECACVREGMRVCAMNDLIVCVWEGVFYIILVFCIVFPRFLFYYLFCFSFYYYYCFGGI